MSNDVTMEGQVTDIRWGSFVLLGLMAIVFGLVIAMFPALSATVLIELIGIFIILVSFAVIMLSAVAPGGLKGSILLAVLGIIGFFFGIATILSPHVMGKVIFILAGIALFIGGLIGLILAISEKNMTHRGLFALQAILSLILGIIIIVGPVIGVALAVIFIGVYFVVWGILSVIMGALIRAAKTA